VVCCEAPGELEVEVAAKERVEHLVGGDGRARLALEPGERGGDAGARVDQGHVEVEPDHQPRLASRRHWCVIVAHRRCESASALPVTPSSYRPGMRMKAVHRCSECGCETPRWLGRCPECQAWGTLVGAGLAAAPRGPARGPVPIGEVDARAASPMPTGVGEL